MIRDDAGEKIWLAHCAGKAVPEIAHRLKLEEEFVKGQIVARWARKKVKKITLNYYFNRKIKKRGVFFHFAFLFLNLFN